MELLQVDAVGVEVLQAFLCVFYNMAGRKTLFQGISGFAGPFEVLGRDLGGAIQAFAGMPLHELAEDLLAFSGAVAPGCVIKITA